MDYESLYKKAILNLLDRFHSSVLDLNTNIENKKLLLIQINVLMARFYYNLFEEILPEEMVTIILNIIQRHIWFVEYYLELKDYDGMKGNVNDLISRDIPRFKKEIQNLLITSKDKPSSKITYESIKNEIQNKLRTLIYTRPTKEIVVQNALENIFEIKEIKYERESGSISYSTTRFIPDFILPDYDVAIEVKLCKSEKEEKSIINQINADIPAYKSKYENALFIVYDLGNIKSVTKFIHDFEKSDKNISVLVIKH